MRGKPECGCQCLLFPQHLRTLKLPICTFVQHRGDCIRSNFCESQEEKGKVLSYLNSSPPWSTLHMANSTLSVVLRVTGISLFYICRKRNCVHCWRICHFPLHLWQASEEKLEIRMSQGEMRWHAGNSLEEDKVLCRGELQSSFSCDGRTNYAGQPGKQSVRKHEFGGRDDVASWLCPLLMHDLGHVINV